MPNVTAPTRTMNNGEAITYFTDTVGTSSVTWTYQNEQEGLTVTNKGVSNLTLTVNGVNYTINPGGVQTVSAVFTAFTIVSSSGTQQFDAHAWSFQKDTVIAQLSGSIVENDRVKVKVDGDVFFVDGVAGNDQNDGTEGSPLKTITAAISQASPYSVIFVKPAIYREQIVIDKPLKLIGLINAGGNFATDDLSNMVDIRTSYRVTSFALFDAVNAVYTYTSSGTPRATWIEDVLDSNGFFSRLVQRSSIADVQANPGSYYRTGTTNYIRLPDNSDPNTRKVEIYEADTEVCKITTDEYVLTSGIAFSLSAKGVGVAGSGEYEFRDCIFRYHRSDYNALGNGLATSGTCITRAIGCRSYRNRNDGYNYHYGGTHELIDCHSYHNDDDGASPHENSYLYVKGGFYYKNGKAGLVAVFAANMYVEDAVCADNTSWGISLQDAKTHGKIVNSVITGNGTGLYLKSGAKCLVSGVSNTGNTTNETIDAGATKYAIV